MTHNKKLSETQKPLDTISRQAAIDAAEKESQIDGAYGYMDTKSIIDMLENLPSEQPNWCDGCKWEYAFGYGECHHCKRNFNDMYEVKDEG